uniref:Heat shock 70 kDa protein 12A-like n=1 Tax=Sinocyclocheilus rhinocerous TaxID=307959 RepID=A0A673IRA0_9TELE
MMNERHLAIHFGRSYSGYAFSFQTQQRQDRIMIPSWGVEYGQRNAKTPTSILFDEDQKFLAFGYDAMMKYTRLTTKLNRKKHYLFEHFMKELYDKEIHRNLMMTAKNGAQMKAMIVFSDSLRYFKDHALNHIAQNTSGRKVSASDVTWVLTVPAIWHPAAKQFMREAAIEAGLVTDSEPEKFLIALESEAAFVYCKQLPSEGFIAEETFQETLEQNPGTQFMVVDCGGETIDITVHEVMEEGHLKKLHAASANDMGGQAVDRKFTSFLKYIFSEEIFMEFEHEYPAEVPKLQCDIALIKSSDGDVLISCPFSFQAIARRKQSIESYFEGVHGAEWYDGRILIKEQQLRSCFTDSLWATADKIKQIMKNNELNIESMLLIGGYAESPMLRDFMTKHFSSRCRVLCPVEPQFAIIKGAVMYGKQPKVVKSCAPTYCVSENMLLDESIHKGKNKYVNSEGHECYNVCTEKLVSKGESVLSDEFQTFTFSPTDNQITMAFKFDRTRRQNVKCVDESGAEPIGSFTVGIPISNRGLNREVSLEMKFGFTEMKVTVTDIDSKEKGINQT